MSQSYDFYIARADEAANEANNTPLMNVRERALRSESAWREMAARVLKVEHDRKLAEQDRKERREAEQLALSTAALPQAY